MRAGTKGAYRKDIDGLRAVAVLPVLAYHVGMSKVPGGFVGVDVFFVISGYLITQMLVADSRGFSLVDFYERRIRRIVPALIAVLVLTFAFGIRYCLPDELVALAKSTIAAIASVSNFYFWTNSGYFDGDKLSKPLLHTWSLGVEEQFYLVWPLYLAFGRRYLGRWLLPTTVAIAAISLAVAAVGAFRFPDATFFLPFTRLWELAAGGLLAMGAMPVTTGAKSREILAAAGLLLICASVLLIHSTMPFPGLLAVPPVAGALFVIAAGKDGQSLTGRALSLRPITFIGAISYSLYLWHWPINVLQKNYGFLAPGLTSGASKLLIMAVSIAVAALSYYLVEQPFRTGRFRPARRPLFTMAAGVTAFIVTVGAVAMAKHGLPDRFSPLELQTVARLNLLRGVDWRAHRCFLFDHRIDTTLALECLTVSPDRPNALLIGDSHAAQLWKGLAGTFDQVNWLQATVADCLPTIVHRIGESPHCEAVIDDVIQHFLPHEHIGNVVLAARWSAASLDNLAATLDWMTAHKIRVTLIGPNAVYDAAVPRLVLIAMRNSDPALLDRHLDRSIDVLDARMADLASKHRVDYISLLKLQRENAGRGWPEMVDGEHFNAAGSQLIARDIQKAYPALGL